MRRAAKVDNTQREIVAALRGVGCSVRLLHGVGEGCPDALVGLDGETYLLEIKTKAWDKLTPDEAEWHETWRGRPVAVVRTVDEALRVVGRAVAEHVA